MVHHDWMLRVYEWMGILKSVCKVIEQLMMRWKTRLEVFDQGKKVVSRWIEIKIGFLQGDRTPQWVSVSRKHHLLYYWKGLKDTERAYLEIEK